MGSHEKDLGKSRKPCLWMHCPCLHQSQCVTDSRKGCSRQYNPHPCGIQVLSRHPLGPQLSPVPHLTHFESRALMNVSSSCHVGSNGGSEDQFTTISNPSRTACKMGVDGPGLTLALRCDLIGLQKTDAGWKTDHMTRAAAGTRGCQFPDDVRVYRRGYQPSD